MNGIKEQMVQFAKDEGYGAPLELLSSLQVALETLCDIGSDDECGHAAELLHTVEDTTIFLLMQRLRARRENLVD